jgi:integrase/recombinase XerD
LNEITLVNSIRGSRVVYLTPQAHLSLYEYLLSRKDDNPALFIASKKPYTRLGNRAFQKEIKKIAERADLKKEINPSSFRNTFIKNMLKKGCPIYVLQGLTGHKIIHQLLQLSLDWI